MKEILWNQIPDTEYPIAIGTNETGNQYSMLLGVVCENNNSQLSMDPSNAHHKAL